ncbi:MAG: Cytochrome c oxidase assembly protein cox15 [Vezdaea aestivalis]|nr:MAG: Cytochrome c oxidase assembly protein cox15 [Vezdaea aestivalis]
MRSDNIGGGQFSRFRRNPQAGFGDVETGPHESPLNALGRSLDGNPTITYHPALPKDPHAGNGQRTVFGKHRPFWPRRDGTVVARWLFLSAGSVFGLVVLGGLTRLTESGLSITEWRPVAGSVPPLSKADWASEFDKYRASPEFALLNPNITLNEFKKIYWMEWGHRLWGRVVGITYVVPLIYFVLKRRVTPRTAVKLCGIGGLIGFQGFLGWWMVKSGLKDDLFEPGSHPRVSQYRLVSHLGTAFIIYGSMVWMGLNIMKEFRFFKEADHGRWRFRKSIAPYLNVPRRASLALTVLVFITAMSGGIVAGLDAGMIYNEWPLMDGGLAPPKAELFKDFYSRRLDKADRWWRNMLENPAMAQLDHRILAVTTFSSVIALWAYTRLKVETAERMPPRAKVLMLRAVQIVCVQAALGITTLLYLVPVPLAAAHQAGSLALFTVALALRNRLIVSRLLLSRCGQIMRKKHDRFTPQHRPSWISNRKWSR